MSDFETGDVSWLANQDKLWEVYLVLELLFTHDVLSLVDHVDLDLQCLSLSLRHAVGKAVSHHCDQEVHEDNDANNQLDEPN